MPNEPARLEGAAVRVVVTSSIPSSRRTELAYPKKSKHPLKPVKSGEGLVAVTQVVRLPDRLACFGGGNSMAATHRAFGQDARRCARERLPARLVDRRHSFWP